ncbi:MAG: CDP-alcohol phosphatidyltransferase family protein [Deltaproteobacteria bacterium]|nr:CDP-alcohol phosphatidyltransferase family protein [Deltaproteobacteria bacterium]MBW2361898.1 CDP-alcohol phosphatidyltransferase family protein [Deltaproteobacteria bacterium]
MEDGVRRILAWGVHLFTACGAVTGTLALVATLQEAWTAALLLMLLGLFIDAVDGMLARRLEVRRFAARIDGRRLDDIVDYLNYVIVPAVFLVATGLLPHWAWTIPPVLASAYGFSQVAAKTEDDFFLGFPSYWNVLAIYSFLLGVEPLTCTLWVVVLAGFVFIPWRYAYPSRLRSHRASTFAGAMACFALVGVSVLAPERAATLHLVEISLLFPVWYVWLSWQLGGFRLGEG